MSDQPISGADAVEAAVVAALEHYQPHDGSFGASMVEHLAAAGFAIVRQLDVSADQPNTGDLVAELRKAKAMGPKVPVMQVWADMMSLAAEEIERLRAQLDERYWRAVERIAQLDVSADQPNTGDPCERTWLRDDEVTCVRCRRFCGPEGAAVYRCPDGMVCDECHDQVVVTAVSGAVTPPE